MSYRAFGTLVDPYWQRQPEETAAAFARFCEYRDMPRGSRSLSRVADGLSRTRQAVQAQASAHRWDVRAAAFDEEQSRQHHERIARWSEQLAEQQIALALEVLLATRVALRHTLINGPMPGLNQLPKLADVAIRLGDAAMRAPERVRAAERPEGAAEPLRELHVNVPELAELEPAERQQQITELVNQFAATR